MAQLKKKFLKLGTGTQELNARDLNANFTPSNYTPVAVGAEATTQISANLKGLDNAVTSSLTDIRQTSFAGANNQVAAANVTGFVFSNASVRSFKALVSVSVDATADLFEEVEIAGIQLGADWSITTSYQGDASLVVFSITSAGQIQYTSASYAGFSSLTIKFRAITTGV